MSVCKYFLKGSCYYGDHCKFLHPQTRYENRKWVNEEYYNSNSPSSRSILLRDQAPQPNVTKYQSSVFDKQMNYESLPSSHSFTSLNQNQSNIFNKVDSTSDFRTPLTKSYHQNIFGNVQQEQRPRTFFESPIHKFQQNPSQYKTDSSSSNLTASNFGEQSKYFEEMEVSSSNQLDVSSSNQLDVSSSNLVDVSTHRGSEHIFANFMAENNPISIDQEFKKPAKKNPYFLGPKADQEKVEWILNNQIYSTISNMSEVDISLFKSQLFESKKIPIIPPPREFCFF